jgi:hypothetical protein
MAIEESKRGRCILNGYPWYAFVSQETYHIRLSSITRDDLCVCTLLTDYQKSTDQ